jgi:hypothetical protein
MQKYVCIAMLEDPPYNLIVAVTDCEPKDWCAKLPLPSHLLNFEQIKNADLTFKQFVRRLQIENIKVETNKAFPAKPYEVIRVFKRILDEGLDSQEINTENEEPVVRHIVNTSDVKLTSDVKSPTISLYSARQQLIETLGAKLTVSSATHKGLNKFFARHDGIAEDTETGLMWLRFAHGQTWQNGAVVGDVEKVSWIKAFEIAEKLNQECCYGGYSDWRVPTIEELESLIDRQHWFKCKSGDTIDSDVFPNNSPQFWSSSSYTCDHARVVYFSSGNSHIDNKNLRYAVRLVRGGNAKT